MADETNMNYLYTVGGYITLAGVGYALYQVSTSKARKKATAVQPKPVRQQPEPRREETAATASSSGSSKKKKQQPRTDGSADAQGSSSHVKSRAKTQQQPKVTPQPEAFTTSSQVAEAPDDDIDNAEFARQLSKAKQGKQFAKDSSSGKKQKEKSVKQSRANKINKPIALQESLAPAPASAPEAVSEAEAEHASTTDDDATSPEAVAADAAGVADMLEPTPSGPSVLRLTDTEPKTSNKKKAKAPEVVETKKQRQNRKKAEAAKAAREEAEKERRVLEEKQRRAARIAEGRPAKDGSQYTAASVKSSAWSQGAPSEPASNGATNGATNGAAHGFLDTFDETPAKEVAAKPATAKELSSESAWISSLPSEEEQLEMLKEEDEWNTVKTKSSKRSKKDNPIESTAPATTAVPASAAADVQPKRPTPVVSSASASSKPQSFGSFSALTAKDDTPEEEVEEEWDV
ncbi:hypothetical protein GMORB2_5740 [Geosmithia morbida]|uniref:Uncharacterized protein n=1 Tax=Geosmithia morbida TaxID=1094350 RepID=A0A9P5D6Z6_9HYPO|nr:uncharacterized protein GMORB2_5740 [Geosmithia morbida]KAF4124024.1 hypothetical protein GMORB2_5740 [Geosmithia morbida]